MRLSKGIFPKASYWLVVAFIFFIIISSLSLYAFDKRGNGTTANILDDTIRTSKDYVGPPQYMRYQNVQKYKKRVVLDLNAVDSLSLIRVSGIGPAFAHRILSLRRLLGGYYTVEQLQEVYGMNEDKYLSLRGWFKIKTPPTTYRLEELKADELPNHIYLSYKQRRAINKLLYRNVCIYSWSQLMKLPEFSYDDSVRLSHYFIEKEK